MLKIILTILICLSACLRAKCDEPFAVLEKNYTQMRDVNIAYEASIPSELSPYFIKTFPNQAKEPKWQQHISFSADKKGFVLEISRLGKNKYVHSFSYEGSTYSRLSLPESYLMVSKKNVEVPVTLWSQDPLLFPAAMLAKSQNSRHEIYCLWRDVINPGFWTDSSTVFSSNGKGEWSGTINGNKTIVTESGKDLPLGISAFDIYQGATDKPGMKYVCHETAEVSFDDNGQKKTFVFPKKAVFQAFDETGELCRTDIIEITKINVNAPGFDEARFAVNPALAAHVYDRDAGKWIK